MKNRSGISASFWHQVGNDRVVADTFNDGYTVLWDGERQYRFGNFYNALARQFAGGFGYLRVGGTTWSTLYPDRPAGASYRQIFGMGYYEKLRHMARAGQNGLLTRLCDAKA